MGGVASIVTRVGLVAPSPRDWIDTLMNEREREIERDVRLCIDCAKAKATKNEGWSFEEGGREGEQEIERPPRGDNVECHAA